MENMGFLSCSSYIISTTLLNVCLYLKEEGRGQWGGGRRGGAAAIVMWFHLATTSGRLGTTQECTLTTVVTNCCLDDASSLQRLRQWQLLLPRSVAATDNDNTPSGQQLSQYIHCCLDFRPQLHARWATALAMPVPGMYMIIYIAYD